MANNRYEYTNVQDLTRPPVYPPYDRIRYNEAVRSIDAFQVANIRAAREGRPVLPSSIMQTIMNQTVSGITRRKNVLILTTDGFYMLPYESTNQAVEMDIPVKCNALLQKYDTALFLQQLNEYSAKITLAKIGSNHFMVTITKWEILDSDITDYEQGVFIVEFEKMTIQEEQLGLLCQYSAKRFNNLVKDSRNVSKLPLPWGFAGPTWGKIITSTIAMPTADRKNTSDIVAFGYWVCSDEKPNKVHFDRDHALGLNSQFTEKQINNSFDVLKADEVNETDLFTRRWIRHENLQMQLDKRLNYSNGAQSAYFRYKSYMAVAINHEKILIIGGQSGLGPTFRDTFYIDIKSNEISKGPSLPLIVKYMIYARALNDGSVIIAAFDDDVPSDSHALILDFKQGTAVDPQWEFLPIHAEQGYGEVIGDWVYEHTYFLHTVLQLTEQKVAFVLMGKKSNEEQTYGRQLFLQEFDLQTKTLGKLTIIKAMKPLPQLPEENDELNFIVAFETI